MSVPWAAARRRTDGRADGRDSGRDGPRKAIIAPVGQGPWAHGHAAVGGARSPFAPVTRSQPEGEAGGEALGQAGLPHRVLDHADVVRDPPPGLPSRRSVSRTR